jgi:hypothetical protein
MQRKLKKIEVPMTYVNTRVTRDINMMAKTLANSSQQTLSEFLATVLTSEIDRLWRNQPPPEDNGTLRTIVREEIARTFG